MKIDNLEILNGLIAGAEGGTVEFKETTGQLERGMETLCAFLNGTGGTVLFGVTDKGKIIGQEVSYLHVLLSLFLCDVKGVEVEVVFAQRFLHGDVPVVRFTITV